MGIDYIGMGGSGNVKKPFPVISTLVLWLAAPQDFQTMITKLLLEGAQRVHISAKYTIML